MLRSVAEDDRNLSLAVGGFGPGSRRDLEEAHLSAFARYALAGAPRQYVRPRTGGIFNPCQVEGGRQDSDLPRMSAFQSLSVGERTAIVAATERCGRGRAA